MERLRDDQFVTFANEALIELEQRYGVTTPIEERVRSMTERYYRGLELVQLLDGQMSVDELADELGVDAADVRERLAYLSKFDRVRRDGETIHRPKQ